MSAQQNKSIIIGTAGHVDHGKTQLVRALTGIDTDRLSEEKKRGITIDLGFAWLDLPDGSRAGIVDVPGHEKFIKNMLAGAGGIDLAMLVVAADDGVMPQTREHLGILSLLGVKNGLIVLTKADLVDEEWLELVKEDLEKLTKGSFLENSPISVVSAVTGQGIDELRQQVFELIKRSDNNVATAFRLPVDRVFTVEGFGTVVTGTLIEGSLNEGDTVEIYPSELTGRVRSLQVHGQDAQTVWAGQRVAVNLAGVRKEQIFRGDTLAAPGSMQNSLILDVKLSVLKDSDRVLKNASRLHFYLGAGESLCKLILLGRDELAPGQESFAQLRFTEAISAKKGDRFVLRFYSPLETVGGGVVLDANPLKHRRHDKRVQEALKLRAEGSTGDNLLQAIQDASPRFITLPEIQKQLGIEDDVFKAELGDLIDKGAVLRLSSRTAISAEYRDTLGRQVTKLLRDYHISNPLQTGMRRDELRGKLLPGREISLTDKVLSLLEDMGIVVSVGQKLALADFQVQFSPADKKLYDEISDMYKNSGFAPPTVEEAYSLTKDKAAAKRVFDALVDGGELIIAPQQMPFHRQVVEDALDKMKDFTAQQGQITLAEFRDLTGTSRKYALPLLEYFDNKGITRKVGDARVLLKP